MTCISSDNHLKKPQQQSQLLGISKQLAIISSNLSTTETVTNQFSQQKWEHA